MFRTETHESRRLLSRRTRCEYLLDLVNDVTTHLASYDKVHHKDIVRQLLVSTIYKDVDSENYDLLNDTRDVAYLCLCINVGHELYLDPYEFLKIHNWDMTSAPWSMFDPVKLESEHIAVTIMSDSYLRFMLNKNSCAPEERLSYNLSHLYYKDYVFNEISIGKIFKSKGVGKYSSIFKMEDLYNKAVSRYDKLYNQLNLNVGSKTVAQLKTIWTETGGLELWGNSEYFLKKHCVMGFALPMQNSTIKTIKRRKPPINRTLSLIRNAVDPEKNEENAADSVYLGFLSICNNSCMEHTTFDSGPDLQNGVILDEYSVSLDVFKNISAASCGLIPFYWNYDNDVGCCICHISSMNFLKNFDTINFEETDDIFLSKIVSIFVNLDNIFNMKDFLFTRMTLQILYNHIFLKRTKFEMDLVRKVAANLAKRTNLDPSIQSYPLLTLENCDEFLLTFKWICETKTLKNNICASDFILFCLKYVSIIKEIAKIYGGKFKMKFGDTALQY